MHKTTKIIPHLDITKLLKGRDDDNDGKLLNNRKKISQNSCMKDYKMMEKNG